MSDELKTCPFCGGEAEVVDIYGACCVRCTVCFVYQEFETSKDEAVQLWNRRAKDVRIKELEGLLKLAAECLKSNCVCGNCDSSTINCSIEDRLHEIEAALKEEK